MKNSIGPALAIASVAAISLWAGVRGGQSLGTTLQDAGRASASAPASAPASGPTSAPVLASEKKALGETLPPEIMQLELRDVDGGTFKLADLAGQAVVVDLWASWCPTCRAQLPELAGLSREFAGRKVAFVGLSIEDPSTSLEAVREASRQAGIPYKIGFVPRDAALKFAILQSGKLPVPQTWVLNSDASVRAKAIVMEVADARRAIEAAGA